MMRRALSITVAHVMTLGAILMRRPQREQGGVCPLADYSTDRLRDSDMRERNQKSYSVFESFEDNAAQE